MNILLLAATSIEIESFKAKMAVRESENSRIQYLISGVGAVQTTYTLTSQLKQNRPDFVIAAGIGGCFSREIALGSVCQVRTEVFADLGVQEKTGWHDLFDLGLDDKNVPPFTDGKLQNPYPPVNISAIIADGCTVNQVTTDPARIESIRKLYNPLVESMEGAAIHYVCINEAVPFIHLRSISNVVGERDKLRWKMKEAIENLGIAIDETIQILLSRS